MYEVNFFSEEVEFTLKKAKATKLWLLEVIKESNRAVKQLSFIFTSDEHLARIVDADPGLGRFLEFLDRGLHGGVVLFQDLYLRRQGVALDLEVLELRLELLQPGVVLLHGLELGLGHHGAGLREGLAYDDVLLLLGDVQVASQAREHLLLVVGEDAVAHGLEHGVLVELEGVHPFLVVLVPVQKGVQSPAERLLFCHR